MKSAVSGQRGAGRRAATLAAALAAAALGVVAAAVPALGQKLPMERTLPLALAQEAANAAHQSCEAAGYRVSVAVVGRAGLVKVLIRGDGAGPHTLDSASRKAYTALSLRHSTADLVRLALRQPEAEGLADMNERILLLGGGLPIKAGEEVIGGIGVGGAPGAQLDEACAQAGIEAIRDRLK